MVNINSWNLNVNQGGTLVILVYLMMLFCPKQDSYRFSSVVTF